MSNQKEFNLVSIGYTKPASTNNKEQKKFNIMLSLRADDIKALVQAFKDAPEPTKINPSTNEPYPKSIMCMVGLKHPDNGIPFWSTSIMPPMSERKNGAEIDLDELDDMPF